ncbi:hypothetical protein ACLSU7_06920 [Bdellovibrio sp. HCB185ZH]|uniref:hypothetical protein n=1 Tax=Bdellovibrio sp. HCB185ZH TaxID=3394235 RepID=UPI0039A5A548
MINDPDRLQSESFNIQSQELTLMGYQTNPKESAIQISMTPALVETEKRFE